MGCNRLEGKVAIITGGARGIGEATVRHFLSHGAKVVIADVRDNLREALCHELGEGTSYIHCDVTNMDDVHKTVSFTVEKFGKLDIMAIFGGFSTYAYACSKTAIVGLMKNAAVEFGIRVNCVSPYGVVMHLTDGLVPVEVMNLNLNFEDLMSKVGNLQGVVLKAEDIAQAALYLASDDAKYVSGQNLFVDGGVTIVNPSLVMDYSSLLGQA
ncbi:hypothetical protein AMTR_s00030p00243810 [Amborella trichopoda]|uniref:Uncharacterized protein n=1 Tax=Amborella trichopoda TaxID=13333 RepID=U5D767_AMBTC|nr:hypothetical protein AMTR_s00030p00243810 [Amborella trichopoda]